MSDQPQVLSGTYRLGPEIGRGSFASVYKGQHLVSKAPVAVKSVHLARLNKKLLENLESEITILKRMTHPHIVALIDSYKTPTHFFLIMEYCSLGDLSYFFKRRKEISDSLPLINSLFQRYPPPPHSNGLHEDLARHFLKQLASALEFLRQHHLVHRDIKPQNLLLCPPKHTEQEAIDAGYKGLWELPVLKLADFGFARILPSTSMAETLCGSPLYMAPEILRLEKYTAKADLWSVGAVLFEMVAGRPPFKASTHVNLLAQIEQMGDTINFPEGNTNSRDIKRLIRSLLKKDATQRMSFAEFFNDPVIVDDIRDADSLMENKPLDQSFLTDDLYIAEYIQLGPNNPRDRAELERHGMKQRLPPASNRQLHQGINNASNQQRHKEKQLHQPHYQENHQLTEITNWQQQQQEATKPYSNCKFNATLTNENPTVVPKSRDTSGRDGNNTGHTTPPSNSINEETNSSHTLPAPPTPPHSVPRTINDVEPVTSKDTHNQSDKTSTDDNSNNHTTNTSHLKTSSTPAANIPTFTVSSHSSTSSTSSFSERLSQQTNDQRQQQQQQPQPHSPKSFPYSSNSLGEASPSPSSSWLAQPLLQQHNKPQRRGPHFPEDNNDIHHHYLQHNHLQTNLNLETKPGPNKIYGSSRNTFSSANNSNTSLNATKQHLHLATTTTPAFGAGAGAGANASNNSGKSRAFLKSTTTNSSSPSSSSPTGLFPRPLESEYVVVEKRTVEVNSFADELTHSPVDHHHSKPSSRNNSVSSQSSNHAGSYQNQQYQYQYNQQQQQLQHRRNSSTRSSPGSAAVAVAMAAASAAAASAAAVAAAAAGGTVARRHRNSSSSGAPGSGADFNNPHYLGQPPSPSTDTGLAKGVSRRLSIVHGSSPSNALARALSMASARLFGTRVTDSGDVLETSPPQFSQRVLSTTVDAEENRFVRHITSLATKAKAISIFAEVKYSQLLPSNGQGGTSSDVDLSADAMVVVAHEALALYLKTLSLLSRIMKETSVWWKSRGGSGGIGDSGAPSSAGSLGSNNGGGSAGNSTAHTYLSGGPPMASKQLIEQVQWIRDKFNESLDKAEYAQMQINKFSSNCTEAVLVHCKTLKAQDLIFYRAIEMSKSAAVSEAAFVDLEGSEISYGTAIWMLQSLLEPDEEDHNTIDASERSRVVQVIETITRRLQVVRKKMAAQQQTGPNSGVGSSGATLGSTPTGSLPRSLPHSPHGSTTTCPSPSQLNH